MRRSTHPLLEPKSFPFLLIFPSFLDLAVLLLPFPFRLLDGLPNKPNIEADDGELEAALAVDVVTSGLTTAPTIPST